MPHPSIYPLTPTADSLQYFKGEADFIIAFHINYNIITFFYIFRKGAFYKINTTKAALYCEKCTIF